MTPADVQWLASPAGHALLAKARATRGAPLHRRHRDLARDAEAHLVRLALLQDELRARAAAKTPHAERLLYDREALEQATAWPVAAERARRWPGPPEGPVADLGAGLGFDALAAAEAGRPVVAVERDATRAALLEANARALDVADRLEVRCADLTATEVAAPLAFLDPDRRAGGPRSRDPERFEPPPSAWPDLLGRYEAAMVKLPPRPATDVLLDAPFEVVSLDHRARERRAFLGAWGDLPPRRALSLPGGAHVEGSGAPAPAPREPAPGVWLLDPDAAVLHAGLVGDLARRDDLAPIASGVAYLLGDRPVAEAPGTWLRIDAVLPVRARAMQRWLDDHEIGSLTLRKRGIDARVADWRKRLRPRGPTAGALVLTCGPNGRWLALACMNG